MPIPRCRGEVPVISLPSRRMDPSVGNSKPAIIRSKVVLPQPLGPRIERNSPERISRETSWTAYAPSKRFEIWRRERVDTSLKLSQKSEWTTPSADVKVDTIASPFPSLPHPNVSSIAFHSPVTGPSQHSLVSGSDRQSSAEAPMVKCRSLPEYVQTHLPAG